LTSIVTAIEVFISERSGAWRHNPIRAV